MKYINNAIIGNQTVTASFSEKGELLRVYYPQVDFKQFIEKLYMGVKVNNSAIIYLHDDINNFYTQTYVENTNVLQTEIFNTYFKLRVTEKSFVPIKENILVRNFTFKNENSMNLKIDLLCFIKALSNINNDTCGYFKNDCLIQYNHDYSVCIFSKQPALSYQINGAEESIKSGIIGGKDYIGLSSDSAISYRIKELLPGESAEISVYFMINDNSKNNIISDLDRELERIRKIDFKDLLDDTLKYWKKFVKEHDKLNIEKSKVCDKIKKIYKRSILLFPLLQNKEIGGISAGVEVDEYKTKCGRYSYCWPRDAAFITKALDIVGMYKETTKFYSVFCEKTQSRNGMWEQRFYTDGRLAPSWGYQIDETASVIVGLYDHYQRIKDKNFLKDNYKMCEKAVEFLQKYIQDILENKNEMQLSYDLWEEHEGISLYSISAVFAGISAFVKISEQVKPLFKPNRLKIEAINKNQKKCEEILIKIKEYSFKKFFDENRQIYVRNAEDNKMDISILGSVVPFGMFSAKEKKVINTINEIDLRLRTHTGGYLRYENDGYMGGNPWPIATLWMALYNIEIGEIKLAKENFEFVCKSASEEGFLGEQVDNITMKPNWVIGLAWSHAMFLIVLEKLKGEIF